jgi:hypothetical protein
MGIGDFFKSVGRGIARGAGLVNEGLKATKIVSTLAPVVGAAMGRPGLGAAIGSGAAALGYQKGGRVLKPKGMAKGGMVLKKQKKPKKQKPKKQKKKMM